MICISHFLIWLRCLQRIRHHTFSPLANEELLLLSNISMVLQRQISSELPSPTCETRPCRLQPTCANPPPSPPALGRSFVSAHDEQNIFSSPFTHVNGLICNALIFPTNVPRHFPPQPLLVSAALASWGTQWAPHNLPMHNFYFMLNSSEVLCGNLFGLQGRTCSLWRFF